MDRQMEIGSSSSSADAQAVCLQFKNELATEFAKRLQLTEQEKADRKEVVEKLLLILKQRWPNCVLLEYGSMVSTLALRGSDIDVSFFPAGLNYEQQGDSVLIKNMYDGNETDGQLVNRIGNLLSDNGVSNEVIPGAKVPIVKFEDCKHHVHVDISVNKLDGYLNSMYLYDFQSLDPRVSQFILIVKHWAKARGINSSYGGTLSSYSYCLMCINFLQTRKPPILPVLQMECMSKTFAIFEKGEVHGYFNETNRFEDTPKNNKEYLLKLLGKFFHYWADEYNYLKDIISIRTGSILSRTEKKNWSTEEGIAIEDPFNTDSNVSNVQMKELPTIRKEFSRAQVIMRYKDDDDDDDGQKQLESLCE